MAKYLIIAWFIASIFVFGNTEILDGPQDTEAKLEETIQLKCTGTLGNLEWQHLACGASNPELVFKDGFVFNGYKQRFSATNTNDGRSVLNIRNVQPSDAGKYTCLENSEVPSQRAAELNVFERVPSNESCAGRYTCKPICDDLDLSCEMKAHGNRIPSMGWIDSEGSYLDSMQHVTSGITTSTVKVKTESYVSNSFTCRLMYVDSALTSKYSWTYSASIAKDGKSQDQHEVVPPPQPVPVMAVVVAVVVTVIITSVVAAVIGVVIFVINKIRKRKTKDRKKPGRGSPVESAEIDTEAGQHLLSKSIEVDKNSGKEKFVPCTSVNKGNPIYGVTAIDDEVFIMTRDGRVVEVFDLYKGTYKRHWPIGGLINPNDMAACPVNKRIFICDWKKTAEDKEIFCFDVNGKQLGRSWVSEYEKGRISITNESNVIVAESWHNTIKEYTSTGALQKTIKSGMDKMHLWQAVKLNDGNFLASFGENNRDHPVICKLITDENGQVIDRLTSDSNMLLSVPRSLAVDKNGNIYICDLYKGRIIVLNPELEYKGIVDTTTDGHKLRGPLRICVHQCNERSWLLVADSDKKTNNWRDGRVAVWKLED